MVVNRATLYKRSLIFLSQAGMSLTKLFQVGNNLIVTGQGQFGYSDIPAGDGKISHLFYSVSAKRGEYIDGVHRLFVESQRMTQ
jgi:hypothetical protein